MTTKNMVLLGCLGCLHLVCHADSPTLNSTSYPYVGVTLSHYSASSPAQSINVVDIDLAAPGIQFRVTPEVPGLPLNSSGTPYTVTRQFTLDFMTNQGAQIAIDASRYWPTADGPGTVGGAGTPVNLEGVVASSGSVYESFFNAWRAPPPPGISWPALNIGFSNDVAILYGDASDPLGHTPLPQEDNSFGHQIVTTPMTLFNTVSGNYQVVSNGIPITADRLFLANDSNPNPRTAIGFTTNNHLLLVAIDGGGSPWYGMTVIQMAWFIKTNLGAFNAINADGGGSTTLAIATPRPHLVNAPSVGPSGRAVGSNLGVFALPAYVQIANIPDGSTFTAPSEIDIAVNVQDTVGTVTNVAYYASGTLLGSQAGSGPFTLPWDNPPVGSYALAAVAMDNAGLNTTSKVVNITVACSAQPAPPTNVSASDGAYCGAVVVSWSPSSGASGYDVYRDGHLVATVGVSPYNDVVGDTAAHSYTVTATYNCGQSAAGPADTGYAAQAPPPPAGVSASDGTYCGMVQVSWSPSTGATGYNVYRDTQLVATVGASPYNDAPGDSASHSYVVTATYLCGQSAASPADTGYAAQAPSAPAGVSASDGTYCGMVQVSWSPSIGATGYNVYRDARLIATVGASPFNDAPGDSASHSYVVTAVNLCGESAAGPANSGYAAQIPLPPTGVSASDGTYCSVVRVSWTPSSGATNYNVYRDGVLVGSAAASPFTDAPGDTANHLYMVAAGNGLCVSAASAADAGYAGYCPPDFSVSASPSSRTVSGGKSTTYTAKYTPINGFSGTVTWSVTGLPTGVSANFTPSGNATVLLTVNSAKTTRSGTYTLTLFGTSGTLRHSTTVSLIVR